MAKLPRLHGKQVIKVLTCFGFVVVRIKGSHHFVKHFDGRGTVVPVHGNEVIGPGLLLQILKDCDISKEEFVHALGK